MSATPSHDTAGDQDAMASGAGAAPRLRPEPKLTGRGLFVALGLACLLPLGGLTIYAVLVGGAFDKPLPVEVRVDRLPVPLPESDTQVVADVVVLKNLADFDIPRVTIDLNGQYFLHRDAPLKAGEELVLPQSIFCTKSNQRWEPGAYPLTEINVTGQLPSRSRGVLELELDPES